MDRVLYFSWKTIGRIELLPVKAIGGILQRPLYLVSGDMNHASCGTQPKPFASGVHDSYDFLVKSSPIGFMK